ncbi:MAG: hypothetical protein AAB896_01995 [Patescibacteria group bacterium]
MVDNENPAEAPPPEIEAELPLPEATPKPEKKSEVKPVNGLSHWRRFRGWYVARKKWSTPLSVLAILLLLLAIPATRYPLAGLALEKNFTVQINDQTTSAPISGATVSSGNISTLTDGNGKANLRLSVGRHNVKIAKKYYQDRQADVLVPILGQKTPPVIAAQATGRQVKVTIKNTVSNKTLADVDIKVLDITAKTDKDGKALLVLPAGVASQKASLSQNGYNPTDVVIKVSDTIVAENNFTVTPAGKVYFLSKQSGKIDVVKANLDGSSREIVLAGTGREDNQNTVLLASRDWKYLALLSRRDSDLAKLYMIETGSDNVTAIDEGNATFSLIGWSDANFVYQVDRIGYQLWQPKAQALKSYSTTSNKIAILAETDAQGSSNFDYNYENLSDVYIVGQRLVFVKSWYSTYFDNTLLNDNQLGIYSIAVAGTGGRSTHKTFGYAPDQSTYLQSFLFRPDQVNYQIVEKSDDPKYFVYSGGQVSEKPSISSDYDNYLNDGFYNTYLVSPSGNSTFWSESRDGKNSLFIGDSVGGNAKQIASASDYQTYGWYSEDYLLASKNGSELYILASDGVKKDSEALKITDYHKPVISYPGYGGYGGI